MKSKKFDKKLVVNRETIADLNDVLLDGIKGKMGRGTNYMTCDGEDPCDTDRTCNDPNCQAALA